ncbi:MAG: hypothetical protein IJQ36_04595 [Oscillospiraceae bacterium]|nr:hypothetical protein [Oscillospiraceae bacterium]
MISENKLNLKPEDLENVAGGLVVDDGDGQKFWLVRQDGTVISPVPSRELAIDFAKAYNISPNIMTREEYARHFGRELRW